MTTQHPVASRKGTSKIGESYFPQLDALRAFAVGAVMWHHWAPEKLHFGLPWGSGVQLFFVLSGFLITGILLDSKNFEQLPAKVRSTQRRHVLRSFYLRRALRIFPLYYLVLALATLAGISSLPETLPWHLFFLSNFGFFVTEGYGSPIGHFWTLAVEEQFYLFWPLLVLFLPEKRLFPAFLLVASLGPAYRLGGDFFSSIGHFEIGTPGSFDSLAIGALCALSHRRRTSVLQRILRFRTFLILVSILLWIFCQHCPMCPPWLHPLDITFLSFVFALVILQASRGFSGFADTLLLYPALRYLGKISYGLYLYHNFASLITRPVLVWFPILTVIPGNWLLCNFLFTLLVASLSWHFFEAPINRLKRRFPYANPKIGKAAKTLNQEIS